MSSYDPPHPPWRRRSKGVSRRSSLASHPQSRRRQPRKRQPRRLTGSRHHPPRLRPTCLWRCRRRPRPPHPPRQRPQHQQRLLRPWRQRHLPQRRHRLRRRGPSQRGPSQRQFRVLACPELPDRLRRPLGPPSNRPPPLGPVPVPPADFLALRADGDPAPRGPETTRSHPRKEWAAHVRRVPSQMAPDLLVRARLRAALHSRAVAREFRACRDRTRR